MSSRNAYLDPDDRARRDRAARAPSPRPRRPSRRTASTTPPASRRPRWPCCAAEPRCAPEYAAVVDPDTFTRPERLDGPALLCVAARVGPARLIDNVQLPRTSRRAAIHRAPVTDAT